MKASSGTTVRVKYIHVIFSRLGPKTGTTDVETSCVLEYKIVSNM